MEPGSKKTDGMAALAGNKKIDAVPPGNKKAEAVTPGNKKPETVTPCNKKTEAVTPGNKKIDAVTPGNKKTEVVTPGNKKTEAVTPGNKKTEAVTPGYKKTEAVTPGNKKTEAVTSGNKKTEAVTPGNKKTEAVTSGNKKTEAVTTGNKKTEAVTPGNKKTEAVTPGNKKMEAVTPGNKKTEAVTPGNKKTEAVTPGNKKTEAVTPGNKKTEAVTPGNKKTEAVTPVNKSITLTKDVTAATNSTTPTNGGAASTSATAKSTNGAEAAAKSANGGEAAAKSTNSGTASVEVQSAEPKPAAGEGDADDKAKVKVDANVQSLAQAEINRLDILVCGTCKQVFHFVEAFVQHKKDSVCLKHDMPFNLNDTKPAAWAFVLWKSGASLGEGEGNSWTLYKRWKKLPERDRDAWVEAGRTLMAAASLGPGRRKNTAAADAVVQRRKKVRFSEPPPSARSSSSDEHDGHAGLSDKKTEEPPPQATRSRTRKEQEESGTDGLESFNVEKILAKRLNPKKNQFEYLIKWEGYANEQNSWEPLKHMSSCENLLAAFERNLARQKAGGDGPAPKPTASKTPSPKAKGAAPRRQDTPGPSGEAGRPIRNSKTRAMANVKTWCGSIGKHKSGEDSSDSDDSTPEKRSRLDDSDDFDEDYEKPTVVKAAAAAVKPATPGVKRGPGRPPGKRDPLASKPVPVASPTSSKQLQPADKKSALSSGVYVVSGQSGVVRVTAPQPTPVRLATPAARPKVSSLQPPPLSPLTPRPRIPGGPPPRVLGARPAPFQPAAPGAASLRGSRVASPRQPSAATPRPLGRPPGAGRGVGRPLGRPSLAAPAILGKRNLPMEKRPGPKCSKPPAVKLVKVVKSDSFDDDEDQDSLGTDSEEEELKFDPPSAPSPPCSPPPLTLCPETGKLLGGPLLDLMQTNNIPEGVTITLAAKPPAATSKPAAAASAANASAKPQRKAVAATAATTDEFITVSGENGILYQVAASGAGTLLGAEVKVEPAMNELDAAVAEAVAQMMPIDGMSANWRVVMEEGGPIVMTTGEDGEPDVEAQIVAQIVDQPEPGVQCKRRIVLLLPDGNITLTEVDEEQFNALELGN